MDGAGSSYGMVDVIDDIEQVVQAREDLFDTYMQLYDESAGNGGGTARSTSEMHDLNIIVYCIAWKPGNELLKSYFYKISGKGQSGFLDAIQKVNRLNHCLSWLLLVITVILFFKGKRYFWFAIAGLITFLGLIFQAFLFGVE